MAKQGHFVKNWKTRWFVLQGRHISYFANQGDRKCKGVVELDYGTRVEENHSVGKSNCFSVITPAKKFVFRAKDSDELAVWMQAIQNNALVCD